MTIQDAIKQQKEELAQIRATLEKIVESEQLPFTQYAEAEMLRGYCEAFARSIKGGNA